MSENSFVAESSYCAVLENRLNQVILGHETVLYDKLESK